MYKPRKVFFFIMILAGCMLHAQNNVVSNAIQAFHEGDYQKTYTLTSEALANPDRLSGDYIPAAYYYLARSRIQVLRLAIETKDQEQLAGMQNALIESYFDYKEALKTADAQLKADIQNDLEGLHQPILQTGLSALNTAGDRNQQQSVRQSALNAGLGYLEAAYDISPTYLACDLLGQARLASGDSLAALKLLDESIVAYRNSPPSPPDFLIAYVYFRKALVERYTLQDNAKALATLMEGQNFLKSEYGRTASGSLTAELKRAYDNGRIDLVGFELDIYLNYSEVSDEILLRFQEILNMYPTDYTIHISYANLLEKVDINLAIDAYETAISIDESKELAYFNLGALYNNMGKEYFEKAQQAEDEQQGELLLLSANQNFRYAYINMEKAYERNPRSLQTIRALVQLASVLELSEKVSFYKNKENELRGF